MQSFTILIGLLRLNKLPLNAQNGLVRVKKGLRAEHFPNTEFTKQLDQFMNELFISLVILTNRRIILSVNLSDSIFYVYFALFCTARFFVIFFSKYRKKFFPLIFSHSQLTSFVELHFVLFSLCFCV